ncbi:MAG TPA: hypothetical protein VJQ43_01525, partial [Thermoplasmata archaeon]|nr:hypothetical protein [Thermoplasmata archaeon]
MTEPGAMRARRPGTTWGRLRPGAGSLSFALLLVLSGTAVISPASAGPARALPSLAHPAGASATPLALDSVRPPPSGTTSLAHRLPAPTEERPLPPVQMGPFRFAGPHPQSWRGSAAPPGAPFPVGWTPARPADSGNESASMQSPVFSSGHCAGLYPATGNSTYYDGCIGHDEPGIQFYSNLPGSGGNFTWNVTLPVDAGPARNQSNLYVAVWFGMTLNDPLAWMNQCFLEVQLYPDSSYDGLGNSLSTEGHWVGAAVAWQIEAATGFEDPCYYQLLYNNGIPGPAYFNMTGGDKLTVTMGGWATSPYGENLTIRDHTNGARTNLSLYDPYGNFPLNPSYATSGFENGLQWTPGGEYPVAFSFETGHARPPTRPTDPYFYECDPGRPSPSINNSRVPCGSYDPASWVNDTIAPWKIGVPTFRSSAGTQVPAQVAFTQDLGGIDWSQNAQGCPGNVGSTDCSYPWYSYSCSAHAFEFGATDYVGVTEDFGKYHQFATVRESNDLNLGYYPPTNFTIPTCGRPSYSLTLDPAGPASGGRLYFLSTPYSSNTLVRGLAPGAYPIHALGRAGALFSRWSTSGNVSVDYAGGAFATVTLTGNGTLSASFDAVAPLTRVTFNDSVANGSVAVMPNYLLTGLGAPIAKLSSGGTISLPSQIYSIIAYPPPGYNFSRFTVSSNGAVVAAPYFQDSWFVVTGAAANSTVTVTAWYTASTALIPIQVYALAGGVIDFNGTVTTFSAPTVAVGTYSIAAIPSPGWTFAFWAIYGSVVWTDQRNQTNVTLEDGTGYYGLVYIEAYFDPVVTVDVAVPAAGGVSFFPPTVVPNGTALSLGQGLWYPIAVPSPGYGFSSWTVNSSTAGWLNGTSSQFNAILQLNGTLTLTAHFSALPVETLGFALTPANGGSIEFNLQEYANGTNASVTNGSYDLAFLPAPGYRFASSSGTGSVAVLASEAVVYGNGGTIHATFAALAPTKVAVTFVAVPSNATVASLNGTAYAHGATAWLLPGTYPLRAVTANTTTFETWSEEGGLSVGSNSSPATNLTIAAGGTLYTYAAPFVLTTETLNVSPIDVNLSVEFWAVATGVGPFNYTWSGLTPECNNVTGPITVPVNGLWCRVVRTGSFPIGLNISDRLGADLAFPALTLDVRPPVDVLSFSATRTLLDVGTTTILHANVTGGVPAYLYNYSGLPLGCSSIDSGTLVCVPTAPGTSTVSVLARDAFGYPGVGTLTLTVRALPTIPILSASPATVTIGVSTTLAGAIANGVGPFSYVYTGLPDGCSTANQSRLNCTAIAAGSFDIVLHVTDSQGARASAHVSLTVDPAPRVTSFLASPASLWVGNATTLTVTATGGTGVLRYAYAGLPAGCTGGNRSTIGCNPTTAGKYSVQVTVADSFGVEGNGTVALAVTTPPTTIPIPSGSSGGPP